MRLADGPLTVYELEQLREAPALVVLSACDSAVTTPSHGQELMGLTATLLAGGCGAMVGTVAPVLDARSIELITAFYEHLLRRVSPAAALSAARRDIEDRSAAAYATGVAFGCFGAGV